MWEEIFNLAISNGIWSALFVGLLIFQLKDSGKRERKYQETIKELSEHLGVVNDIKEEVQEMKNYMLNKKLI
ncbi:MAG: BhlA/UviB family holin-like peptide [Clostridia bacterium]|nr:BhlA/UviB family holin-like peptide [Clostridia bacterium]